MRITRREILGHLVKRFSYDSYLEIGLGGGPTFRSVPVPRKVGVDPRWRLWSALRFDVKKTTSDRFFARNLRTFDLVLIDGLHVAEQAYRDIRNAIAILSSRGSVLVHDCLPSSREQQLVPRQTSSWTGDVWRALLQVSQDSSLSTLVFEADRGCGWIQLASSANWCSKSPALDRNPMDRSTLSWEEFEERRASWLTIVPSEEVFSTIDRAAGG